MSTIRASRPLDVLCDRLDSLTERASVEQLHGWLAELEITLDDVAEFAQFSEEGYTRNLVRAGENYHVLVLCWRSGQRSPIHDHAHSTCGLVVLEGVATETVFEHMPCGQVKAVSSDDARKGDVCVSQDHDTHQVSNLQMPGQDLVTLHIYSPPLLTMDQYSLTGEAVRTFRPAFSEHLHGSGI